MKIVVCVKQVPNTMEVKIDPKTGTLIRDKAPAILNTFDEFAIGERADQGEAGRRSGCTDHGAS